MRWRLILEEFSPEITYIKGCKSIVADALSRLDKIDSIKNNKVESFLHSLSENYLLNHKNILHPTSFKTIMRFQQKVKSLIEITKEKLLDFPLNNFMGQVRCILLFVDIE